mmetsp:Transcript_9565/g.29787  ORF Transcript_9565/g.29787 Transcript_9565/m.29787 type:complete len:204 (+) Transcript_9565:36-647(+)
MVGLFPPPPKDSSRVICLLLPTAARRGRSCFCGGVASTWMTGCPRQHAAVPGEAAPSAAAPGAGARASSPRRRFAGSHGGSSSAAASGRAGPPVRPRAPAMRPLCTGPPLGPPPGRPRTAPAAIGNFGGVAGVANAAGGGAATRGGGCGSVAASGDGANGAVAPHCPKVLAKGSWGRVSMSACRDGGAARACSRQGYASGRAS